MRKLLFFLTGIAALSLQVAAAQSAFDGTWKVDFSKSEIPKKPEEYLLQDGYYRCLSCAPDAPPIKADGTDQPIAHEPRFDAMAVNVINDHKIEQTLKKVDKIVHRSTFMISPDGNVMTQDFSNASPSGTQIQGNRILTRVTDGPSGSHLISGSWVEKKIDLPDNGSLFTLRVSGNQITMARATGEGFTARIDGTVAPYLGTPDITHVRVKLVGNDTLEETDLRDETILTIALMKVSEDGKKARIVEEDRRKNTITSYEALKQ